jgi:hypothetical protein
MGRLTAHVCDDRLFLRFYLPQVEYCDTFHAIARSVLRKLGMLNTGNDLCDIDEVLLQFLEFLQSNTAASIAFKRTIKYLFIDEFQARGGNMCRALASGASLRSLRLPPFPPSTPQVMLLGCSAARAAREN